MIARVLNGHFVAGKAGLSILVSLFLVSPAFAAPGLASVDYSNLVSRADLDYSSAVTRSEEGVPVGNGRMGTLIWTTPDAIRFQINRVDVFGNNRATDSFPQRHTDYCGGSGFVDIAFGGYGDDPFPPEQTRQHLSCYDGLASVDGRGVRAEIFVCPDSDVMAIRVTDQREWRTPIRVNLRMLRSPFVRNLSQTATSKLDTRDGRIVLTQAFAEDQYYCGSAVAVSVARRETELRRANAEELQLIAKPGRGSFTIFISSAAGFDRQENTADAALTRLEAAENEGYAALTTASQAWWHAFWTRSFIHLHSADGVADDLEANYNYYLYLMASTSRGRFPTKFNGMLWTTGGDRRQWGGQYWGANQSCLYNNALFAANHGELLDPIYDMLSGMLDACSLAAKQQWGSQGAFFPETVAFDGLAPLPDDIAAEMRQLYLLQKPWEERSARFLDYAHLKLPHSSRWNWISSGQWENGRWLIKERGSGPYGPVTHIFSRGAKYAYQFWLRYDYTKDKTWLRDRAFPVLKAVAEFYRHYPNVRKEADGRYHIHDVNSNESVQGAQDTDEEISGMMGVFPVLIEASKILNIDADLRPAWEEFLAHLAPLPRSDNPAAAPSRNNDGAPVWMRGLPPVISTRGNVSGRPDGNTMPMWFFDLCTLESDAERFEIGSNTFNAYAPPGMTSARRVGVLSKVPLVAAVMGRAGAVRHLIPAQVNSRETSVLRNRMDLREGPQTTSAQRLGNAADALHTALCYDLPAGPGRPSVIHVFAAWPREWDADYTLLCRGGFLVTSSMDKGEIGFVEIESQIGGECRVRNPWNNRVTLYRDGREAERVTGSLLTFDTRKGERLVLLPPGKALPPHAK